MKYKMPRDSALLVFGVTVTAYAINVTYELARLHSFGIPFDFVQIKLQNFLLTGCVIGLIVLGVVYIQKVMLPGFDKGIKSDLAAAFTKEKSLQIIVCAIVGFIGQLGVAILEQTGQEGVFIHAVMVAGCLGSLGAIGIGGQLGWFYIKARLRRKTYAQVVEEHFKMQYIPAGQAAIRVVYAAAIVFSLVLVPAIGFSASRTESEEYALSVDGVSKKIIVGIYGTDYIVKEYDTQAKKYLDGYSLIAMSGQTVLRTRVP